MNYVNKDKLIQNCVETPKSIILELFATHPISQIVQFLHALTNTFLAISLVQILNVL